MKRYQIFGGSVYYPVGGMHDYRGETSSLPKARRIAVAVLTHDDISSMDSWSHIWDCRERKIIAVWAYRDGETTEKFPGDWEFNKA